jgi:hypothetical protein
VKSKLAKPQPPLGDQEFADQVIAACDDRSGALLTILEKVQEHNPHKYLPLEILEYISEKTDIPLSQRGHVLCAVQPGAAGRAHHLHLPRHGVPHARLAQPAGEPEAGTGPPGRATTAPTSCALTTPDGKFTAAHGGLLRPVRAGAGGGSQSRICGHMNERTLQREVERWNGRQVMTRIQGHEHIQRRREPAGQTAALPAAHRRRHGHLRHRQRRRRRLSRLRRAIDRAACDVHLAHRLLRLLRQEPLVNVWLPGRRW